MKLKHYYLRGDHPEAMDAETLEYLRVPVTDDPEFVLAADVEACFAEILRVAQQNMQGCWGTGPEDIRVLIAKSRVTR